MLSQPLRDFVYHFGQVHRFVLAGPLVLTSALVNIHLNSIGVWAFGLGVAKAIVIVKLVPRVAYSDVMGNDWVRVK